MARNLVLLTHCYPHDSGDVNFVEAEIWDLSKTFENVYVWTLTPSRVRTVDVPPNVVLAGSLLDAGMTSPTLLLRALRHFPAVTYLMLDELRRRRGRLRFKRLVRAVAVAVVGGARLSQWLGAKGLSGIGTSIYSFWGTDCAFALLRLNDRTSRVVVRLHGYDIYEERVGYLPFRGKLFDRADLLLTASADGASYLARKYSNVALPPVAVSRLGTPDRGIGPGAPAGLVRVVSCSSLIGLKRVGLILDVVNTLAKTRPVHWVHFGDGPLRSMLLTELARKAPTLKVEMRGQVSRAEIFQYYKSTEISFFVNLSTTEGLPVSIMEAMSFGIPILATDVGGTSEIVGRHLLSGLLVPVSAGVDEVVKVADELLDLTGQWDPRRTWDESCNADRNGRTTAAMLAGSDYV